MSGREVTLTIDGREVTATSGESSIGFWKWRFSSITRDLPGPQPWVMSCSGHSPPLSQTGQSSGWLMSRNSNTPARAATTSGVRVLTTMPSVHTVEHDVCSFGIFSILTMQTRHEPSMLMPG